MADNNNAQQQGERPKSQPITIYVHGKPDAIKSVGDGLYDVTVILGLNVTHKLKHAVVIKVTIQGTQIDAVPITEKKEHTFPKVKLDLTKPVKVDVEKGGDPKVKDSVTLSLPDELKTSATSPTGLELSITGSPYPNTAGEFERTFVFKKQGKPAPIKLRIVEGFAMSNLSVQRWSGLQWIGVDLTQVIDIPEEGMRFKFRFDGNQGSFRIIPEGMAERGLTLTKSLRSVRPGKTP